MGIDPVTAILISAGATAISTGVGIGASRQQAKAAKSVAEYNARADIAQAEQLALDANANVARQRKDAGVYLSQQKAAYASSGILSGTGSPMAVQATTAGRIEQDIQQYWTDTNRKITSLHLAAAEGRYEGAEAASAYRMQGLGTMFSGIGSVASLAGQASWYQSQRAVKTG